MSFLIFCAIVYFVVRWFKNNAGESKQYRGREQQEPSTISFNRAGGYHEGIYLEEINVFVRGPINTYRIEDYGFLFIYTEGILEFKNSSGSIQMEMTLTDKRRAVPTKVLVNGQGIIPLDKNGQSIQIYTDKNDISIARTANLVLNEAQTMGLDRNLLGILYETFVDILLVNIMVNRGIITSINDYRFQIKTSYRSNFAQKLESLRQTAIGNIDQYSFNYSKGSLDKRIEKLLLVLELPSNVRNMESIKKQYKKLAKKYHPDMTGGSDKKFKEINEAYEELCACLQAA